MKIFKSPVFWVVVVVVIVVAVIASQRLREVEKSKKLVQVERPPIPVRAVKARRDAVQAFVLGEGTARAVRREFLNFETSGKVVLIGKDVDGGADQDFLAGRTSPRRVKG